MRTPQEKKDYDAKYHANNKASILLRNKLWRENHYEETYLRRRGEQLRRADEFVRWKQSIGCGHCGYNTHGAALDLHHTDPTTKVFRITSSNWKSEKGQWEIAQCEVLCANCHRIETTNYLRSHPPIYSRLHRKESQK